METGDKISADGRLIESCALHADEASLTGESEPAAKDADVVLEKEDTPVAERLNMLYSGCFITSGSGRMVVTAVGDRTEFGKIARELSATEKSSTPLQEKMAKLGKLITLLGAIAAGIVFLIQLFTFLAVSYTHLLKKAVDAIFLFFVEDAYAVKFLHLLMIEQYKNNDAARMFEEWFIDGALSFQTALFDKMMQEGYFRRANPRAAATQFYGPILLLVLMYNSKPERRGRCV